MATDKSLQKRKFQTWMKETSWRSVPSRPGVPVPEQERDVVEEAEEVDSEILLKDRQRRILILVLALRDVPEEDQTEASDRTIMDWTEMEKTKRMETRKCPTLTLGRTSMLMDLDIKRTGGKGSLTTKKEEVSDVGGKMARDGRSEASEGAMKVDLREETSHRGPSKMVQLMLVHLMISRLLLLMNLSKKVEVLDIGERALGEMMESRGPEAEGEDLEEDLEEEAEGILEGEENSTEEAAVMKEEWASRQ